MATALTTNAHAFAAHASGGGGPGYSAAPETQRGRLILRTAKKWKQGGWSEVATTNYNRRTTIEGLPDEILLKILLLLML